MSSGKRRVFSREFKLLAVKRMIDDGERGSALSGELGVSANQLYKWCMHFRRSGAEGLRPACRPRKVPVEFDAKPNSSEPIFSPPVQSHHKAGLGDFGLGRSGTTRGLPSGGVSFIHARNFARCSIPSKNSHGGGSFSAVAPALAISLIATIWSVSGMSPSLSKRTR
jgi:hypothetical protein